ncbi:uncharacterized protein YjdB [Bacilli bacterium PM5-3]|nr:uncharacterized protein YjdB [Bacilli bacterium PM5-3]MDH6603463.1 uncharacterized protein YjdB [Bacilli bacterium PM5-9]
MKSYNFIMRKIILCCTLVFVFVIGFDFNMTSHIKAVSNLEIIQDYLDETKPLRTTLYVGERMDIDVIRDGVAEGGRDVNGFTWTSSDSSVLSTSNGDGVLNAISKGTVIVTVRYLDNSTSSVTIRVKQPATSIDLASSATVYVSTPKQLTANINPSSTDDKGNGVVWTSSDISIATVNSTGIVTARKNGNVVIKATFTNKNRFTESSSPVPKTVFASSNINVQTKVSEVKLNKEYLILKKGTNGQFSAIVLPTTASNKNVIWTGSNSKVFTITNGKIISKIKGFGYIRVKTVDGQKSAYAPVSVYEPINKTTAYTKKKLNIKNGAHKTNKHVSNLKKVKKGSKVVIYAETGNFFYIKSGNIYGFVLKKDLIYMSISSPRLTINKKTKKYPTIKVTVHNGTSTPKWTGTKKVVSFKLKKNSKKTKKYKNGTSITTTIFYVIPKKEGRVDAKVKSGKSNSSYYVSSYTGIKNTEAFVRVKTSNIYKGANVSLPIRSELKKNTKVIILGKCTKGFFYIQYGKQRGFVKASDLTYIHIKDSFNMYRYNNKNINAYLVNSSDDKKIKWYTSNGKTAKINKQITLKNGKQAQIWAEKNGNITLTVSYEYVKGKIIKAKSKLIIKNVKLEIYSIKKKEVGQVMEIKARIKHVTNPKPEIKFSNSSSSIFELNSEKNNVGKYKVYGIGSGKVTVKYRDLKTTKKITTKPLLIYGTPTRPGLSDKGKKSEDILYNDMTSQQIIALPWIDKENSYGPGNNMGSYFTEWELLAKLTTSGDLSNVGTDMIEHFRKGTGSTYTNDKLTKAVQEHKNTQKYSRIVNISFEKAIKESDGNISKMKYKHLVGNERLSKYILINYMDKYGLVRPAFNIITKDYTEGLKFAINQVHATTIEVVSYKYNADTKKYTVKFKHTFYDHFGLDKPDIDKFGGIAGFRSWYILQHDKKFKGKYKPFITKVVFYETTNGKG